MRQMTSIAWKNSSGTSLLQLQQWNPCEWQDQGGSEDKQIFHCTVAGKATNSKNMPLAIKRRMSIGQNQV